MNIYILGLGKRVKELHETAEYIIQALKENKLDASVSYEKRTKQPLEKRIASHYSEIDNADIVIAMRDYYTKHPFDTRLLCEIAYAKHIDKTVLYGDFDARAILAAAVIQEIERVNKEKAKFYERLYAQSSNVSLVGGGGGATTPSFGDGGNGANALSMKLY